MTRMRKPEADRGLTLYPSPLKHGLAALGALFFVVVGVVVHLKRHRIDAAPFLIDIAAYAGVPFFAACLGYAVYRLAVPKPSLVIDDSGIYDNASAIGAGWIAWEEIAEIFPYTFYGQSFLGVVPADPASIFARQPLLKRILMGINRRMVAAPVNIPQAGISISIAELMDRICHYGPFDPPTSDSG